MDRRKARFAVALAVALLGAGLVSAPPASATSNARTSNATAVTSPAGMHRYVVSVGRVVANEATAWVRLAQYTFGDDGTVSSTHWYWTHRRSFVRVSTGIKATNCPARDCYGLPYSGATDRRNALKHWCEANADGRGEYCYTGNSHVKPMLQIIDSDGRSHGWVGVEASPNETVPDQRATLGVFVAADDM